MAEIVLLRDLCGGLITSSLNTGVTIDNRAIVVVGAFIASHGSGPHAAARLQIGSAVTIDGRGIIRSGDRATCTHTATGTSGVDLS